MRRGTGSPGGFRRSRSLLTVALAAGALLAVALVAVPAEGPVGSAAAQAAGSSPTPRLWWTPAEPSAGDTVTLDGSYSYDEDGRIVRYEWDMDGDLDDGPRSETIDATGPVVNWTYNGADRAEVTLLVTDDDNKTRQDGAIFRPDMKVSPNPNVVLETHPDRGKLGTKFTWNATRSMPAPGVQAITEYAFSDLREVGTPTSFEADADGVVTKSPSYPSTWFVEVEVTDSAGNQGRERAPVHAFFDPTSPVDQLSEMPSPAGHVAGVVLALLVAGKVAGSREQ